MKYLVLCLFLAAAASAAAQENEYEQRFGRPVDVTLDDLIQMPEQYVKRAVRTRGRLDMDPAERAYVLRGTFGGRLYLRPVPEAERQYEEQMRRWVGSEVEVTGAVDQAQHPRTSEVIVVMLVWAYLGPPDEKAAAGAPEVRLEDLVTRSGDFEGRVVAVRGQFRGANLFGDLPSATRRRSSDWVLKDGVFAVWVTGKKPKGLDLGLKRDAGKWLLVSGRVSVRGEVVTIEAMAVTLTRPVPRVAAPPAPPPAPPRPRKPPTVVFALPLSGEEVQPDTVFKVQFSDDIDEASFEGRVVLRYAGEAQPGDRPFLVQLSYDLGRRALTVDPGDRLRPGRVVELLLLAGIVDVDGREVAPRVLRYRVSDGGW